MGKILLFSAAVFLFHFFRSGSGRDGAAKRRGDAAAENKIDAAAGKGSDTIGVNASANRLFLQSKGHWQLPLQRCKGIRKYPYPVRGWEPGNPGITFFADSAYEVRAVFEGEIQAVFRVGETSALMIRYGGYFTTYGNLDAMAVFVKKGDSVRTGQVIAKLDVSIRELELLLSDEYDRILDPYPWFDWKNVQPPSGQSDGEP